MDPLQSEQSGEQRVDGERILLLVQELQKYRRVLFIANFLLGFCVGVTIMIVLYTYLNQV